MKRIVLAAAGAAVAALSACSHPAAPAAAPATQANSRANVPVPVSCGQRYHTWQHAQGKKLMAALHAVSAAEMAGNAHAVTAALKKVKPAIAVAASHPVPACADPRGYWSVLLMHVNAAAASTGAGTRAAMKDVPKIEGQLAAELKRITQ